MLINNMYDIFNNKSNNTNKELLLEKSKLYPKYTYCDLIIKKLLLVSTSQEFIIHYSNDIIKKINNILFNHVYNTRNDINNLNNIDH